MNHNHKNESHPEQLRKIQAELDDLHSKGKLNVKYQVLATKPVPKKGMDVELKCQSCGIKKERRMAHIRNRPDKGGCICQLKHEEGSVMEKLQAVLGDDYEVLSVYRKQTTSKQAKYKKRHFIRMSMIRFGSVCIWI